MDEPLRQKARDAFEARYKLKSRAALASFVRYSHGYEDATAYERARADALEAALSDVLEMAQEHADHFAAAFAGYKPERHAYYARALAAARALLEKKT